MKRRYQLLLIITIGAILTILINCITLESRINIVTIGDGVSLGMTAYDVIGTSFNDYLKEYYENKHKLKNFNNDFSVEHMRVEELNDYLKENALGKKSNIAIKQIIAQADIVTISLGMDELIDLSIKHDLDEERIDAFVTKYETMVQTIRSFYDQDFIIIGLYPAYDFDKNITIEVNKQLQTIAGKYNVKFIDIIALSLNPEYYANNSSYYMNYKGHKEIYKLIIKTLN